MEKVVYIEPYPKSATSELYGTMVKIDGDPCALNGAMVFRPFTGVAPRQYLHKFSMRRRKDKRGYALRENHLEDAPRVQTWIVNFELSAFKIKELLSLLEKKEDSQGEENEEH